MDFLIATHNPKKREELNRILAPLGVNVCLDFERGIILNEVEETGQTFEENAMLKALNGCLDGMRPCIADDSGLCVDVLDGRPGVYSARYHGEETPFAEKIAYLLEELKDVPAEKRTARFVSAVACVFPDGTKFTVRGVCEGKIGFAPRGENGFGYDPIFFVGDKSFAELLPAEKDAVSHRGNALRALKEKLQSIL